MDLVLEFKYKLSCINLGILDFKEEDLVQVL